MAINPSTNSTMTGKVTAADANYPYGSAKDEVTPGVSGDGTPYFKGRADDIFGFQQALLQAAGIVPSGNADTAIASQYLQALQALFYSPSFAGNVDADLLEGQNGAFYRNANNINAGVIGSSFLPQGTTSVKGATESATNAETYLATANKGVTAASLVGSFNDNKLNSASGYQMFPGGLIIQWGNFGTHFTTSVVAATDRVVTFPIAFPNAAYGISSMSTWLYIQDAALSWLGMKALSKTSFTMENETPMYWMAIGR